MGSVRGNPLGYFQTVLERLYIWKVQYVMEKLSGYSVSSHNWLWVEERQRMESKNSLSQSPLRPETGSWMVWEAHVASSASWGTTESF